MSEVAEIGQIIAIQGASEVSVRGADNQIRTLKAGDALRPGDTLLAPDGVTLELDAGDSEALRLPGGQPIAVTPDLFEATRTLAEEAQVGDQSVQELVETILSGGDFEQELEATAAGIAGGGEGEGNSFIRLLRIQEATEPANLNVPGSGVGAAPGKAGPPGELPPDAQADQIEVNEDTPIVIDVLANDSDPNFQPIQIVSWTQPGHGQVSQDALTGLPVYTPDPNYFGPDGFQYTIADSAGNTSTAPVSINVRPVNDAPLARPDTSSGPEDSAIQVAVMDNDTDLEGDNLSVIQIDGQDVAPGGSVPVEQGTARLNPDGTITYTPTENFHGEVSFTYTISDGAGGQDSSTVNLTVSPVNDAPVAGDDAPQAGSDAFVTPEDVPLVMSADSLLSNDIDVDGDILSVIGFTQPVHGSLISDGGGGLRYTPDPNYNGPDQFTYTVSDGAGGTDSASVTLQVLPVNDTPEAQPDAFVTDEDVSLRIGAAELLANDSDIDGDTLTVSAFTQPGHGTLAVDGGGNFIYTPNPNYNGPDSFSYTVSDGQGGTDSAMVSLVVNPLNDPPVARGDSASTLEDTPVVISAAQMLSNDSDIDGDTLAITSFTQPAHGSLADNGDGTFTYTPDPGYSGGDSFSYSVSDGHGGSDSAVVALSVGPVNDAPVAGADNATTPEDTPVTIDVTGNDLDVDGTIVGWTVGTGPSHGTVTNHADGTFTYTPDPNYTGADSFSYRATDDQGASSNLATVSLNVLDVNDLPTAGDDTARTPEDTPVTIDVTGNDHDVDGTIVGWTLNTGPAHGTLVNNGNGTFTYTPQANYTGSDSFSYTVSDDDGAASNIATVSLTVDPANDPAVVLDASGSVQEEALQPAGNPDSPVLPSATATGAGIVTDIDGPLPALSLAGPPNGAFSSGGVPINWSGSGTASDPLIGTAGSAVVATVWITSVALAADGSGHYVYNYQFDLSGPVDHLPTVQGEEALQINFTVIANDNPLADTGTLSIGIEDDAPVIAGTQPVSLDYTTPQAPASGALGVSFGADGAANLNALRLNLGDGQPVVDANSGNQMTSDGNGLHWYGDGAGGWFAATAPSADPVIEVSLQPGADQFTVELVGRLDGASTTVTTPLTTAGELHGGNTPNVSFAVDQDNDGDFDAQLNVTGNAGGEVSTVNVSANSMGVGRGQSINPGDQLQIEYRDSDSGSLIPSYAATVGVYVTGSHSASGNWTALSGGVNGAVVDSGSFTASNGASVTIDPDGSFDTLVFTADDGSNYGLNSIELSGQSVIPGITQQVDLGFTATDSDGDVAPGVLSMTFAEQLVEVESKLGTEAPELMPGEEGDGLDILSSGPLVWQPSGSGEPGSPHVDTISDFTPGEHVLQLGDLVQGNSADQLTDYLHFDVAGPDTVIHVSSSGGFADGFDLGAVDLQIILEGVDLSLAGSLNSDLHIIQDLLDKGALLDDGG